MGELDGIKRQQVEKAVRVAEAWMRMVVGEAQLLAPIEEGTLRASSHVTVERTPRGFAIEGRFSTPYAAAQHEGRALQHRNGKPVELVFVNHPRGGQAHYLEEPFKRHLPRLAPALDAAIRA